MPDIQLTGRNSRAGFATLAAGVKQDFQFLLPLAGNIPASPGRATLQAVCAASFKVHTVVDAGDATGANWFDVPANEPFTFEITSTTTLWLLSATGGAIKFWQS